MIKYIIDIIIIIIILVIFIRLFIEKIKMNDEMNGSHLDSLEIEIGHLFRFYKKDCNFILESTDIGNSSGSNDENLACFWSRRLKINNISIHETLIDEKFIRIFVHDKDNLNTYDIPKEDLIGCWFDSVNNKNHLRLSGGFSNRNIYFSIKITSRGKW